VLSIHDNVRLMLLYNGFKTHGWVVDIPNMQGWSWPNFFMTKRGYKKDRAKIWSLSPSISLGSTHVLAESETLVVGTQDYYCYYYYLLLSMSENMSLQVEQSLESKDQSLADHCKSLQSTENLHTVGGGY
jgi:hypothetical protein